MASTKPLRALMRCSSARGSLFSTRSGRCNVTSNLPIAASHSGASSAQHSSPPNSVASHRTAEGFQRRPISSTPPTRVIGWVQEKISGHNEAKMAAKMVEQINLMANSPKWTLKNFADEINWQVGRWQNKLPGAGNTTEVQRAKSAQQVITVLVEQLGEGATVADVNKLDRRGKLKLVVACKKPMDEVEQALGLFKQEDVMHRVLRYRKENGMELPTDRESLQMAMTRDQLKVMTRREKKEMMEFYNKIQEAEMKEQESGQSG